MIKKPLLPCRLEEFKGTTSPRSLEENIRELERVLDMKRETVGTLEVLARILGGQYLQGVVQKASDTAFRHTLGRIPSALLMSTDMVGPNGPGVRGGRLGGFGGVGGNQAAWTDKMVWVRAVETSTYGFVVV